MSGWYVANQVLVQSTFINFLLALSLQVPFRFGVFSFAGVGCYGLGAYTAAIVTTRYGVPGLASVVAAMLLAALVSYLLALVVARLNGLYLGMATISFVLILGVAVSNGGELTGGPTGLFGILADLPIGQIVLVTLTAVLVLAATERGRFGRRVEAVREDPELAASVGIDVRRHRRLAFVLGGLLGGAAGAVNALVRTTVAPTDISFSLVVLALVIIVIGGSSSWLGALIGAVLFTWLPSVLAVVGEYQHLVYGVLVALAAIYFPGGLLGLLTAGRRRLAQRRRAAPPSLPSSPGRPTGAPDPAALQASSTAPRAGGRQP